ncbi:ParA family protein [uncultured Microbulbifer sp.]|uniref:ParA family protein n=1 Tax=uncultured Microbulbifer sp. TaxID=348147 RepID=UPI00260990BC|nr:ParA family protein [uncultured Microbulbifer sp.]
MENKVICIANGKGGEGKTTCGVNLATTLRLLGFDVVYYDADEQGNGSDWIDRALSRDEDSPIWPNTAAPGGVKIKNEIQTLQRAYDFVIVDTPGTLIGESLSLINQAIAVSDLVLIPLKPTLMDIATTQNFCHVVQNIQNLFDGKPPAYLWINQVHNRAGTRTERALIADAESEDAMMGYSVLKSRSFYCEAMANMFGSGACVHDCDDMDYVRRHKAKQTKDFFNLAKELAEILGVELEATAAELVAEA